ncbi:MAG: hypothetical protein WC775_00430 [Patescibacteria group bacterium]|jgi:hypothetical protein
MPTEITEAEIRGSGHLGELDDHFFLSLSPEEQALEMAKRNNCPIPLELILKRGALEMRNRYATVNFWYRWLLENMRPANAQLVDLMERPEKRFPFEPIGKFEEDSVPFDERQCMRGLGHPLNYGYPRGVVEILNACPDQKAKGDALIFIDFWSKEIAGHAKHTLDFAVEFADKLVWFSEKVLKDRQLAVKILYHLVGTGKLGEDNCFTHYDALVQRLQNPRLIPHLSRTYTSLSTAERGANKITDPLDIPVYHWSFTADNRVIMVLVFKSKESPQQYYVERRMEKIEPSTSGPQPYRHIGWSTFRSQTFSRFEDALSLAQRTK